MMSLAAFDMYAGCSTLDEDWVVPDHDGQICTLLVAPQGDFHPPHHRAPLILPVIEKQWTQSQVNYMFRTTYSTENIYHQNPRSVCQITNHWSKIIFAWIADMVMGRRSAFWHTAEQYRDFAMKLLNIVPNLPRLK